MSVDNISENVEDPGDDAAKAAAFLDPEGVASSSSDEDDATQAAAAFLESDSSSDTPEEDSAADAAAAFLRPDDEGSSDDNAAAESAAAIASFSATPEDSAPEIPEDSAPEIIQQNLVLNTPPDDGIDRRWYAVHAHSGQEATVQRSLLSQAELEGLSDLLTNVLVPMEEVAEFKSGEKKVSKRKYFPGYLLVQLPLHPERYADLWHLIKDTTGVTGFIGSRNEPIPLEDEEVMNLVEEIRGERERPVAKVNFDIGERIKIIDGAFANFFGNINEINAERGKMKVMIEIFERQTSVEVEFWQVEKL